MFVTRTQRETVDLVPARRCCAPPSRRRDRGRPDPLGADEPVRRLCLSKHSGRAKNLCRRGELPIVLSTAAPALLRLSPCTGERSSELQRKGCARCYPTENERSPEGRRGFFLKSQGKEGDGHRRQPPRPQFISLRLADVRPLCLMLQNAASERCEDRVRNQSTGSYWDKSESEGCSACSVTKPSTAIAISRPTRSSDFIR